MIHIQFQDPLFINTIEERNNKAKGILKKREDISPDESTTLVLGK